MRPPPHPALRAPLPGGGPTSGDWANVTWSHDRIPLLMSDVEGYLAVVGDDLDAPLDELSFQALAHLARYAPELREPVGALYQAVREALRATCATPVPLAVELGCSVGVALRVLREVAEQVIGIDSSIAALRAAKIQLAGDPLPVLARVEGRSFVSAEPIALPALDGVHLAVGNALDPPLFPEVADIVAALNLLDNVSSPLDLIGQMDAVLKPGGLFVLASPFSWSDDFTPAEAALGGGTDPAWAMLGTAAGLVELLAGRMPVLPYLRYEVLQARDVPWAVREHARSITHFQVHLLVARKVFDPN